MEPCRDCGFDYTCEKHRKGSVFPSNQGKRDNSKGMTQKELFERFTAILDLMNKTMKDKNKDYSGEGEAFTNFNQIELLTKSFITREMGTVVRMSDKLSRVVRLLQNTNNVLDEKIQDTLLDLANYSILLIIMLGEKKF